MLRCFYKIAKSIFSDSPESGCSPPRRFGFETLESKDLLTGFIDFDAFTGIVTIQGDTANDVARCFDDGGRVTVTLEGVGQQSFVRNLVDRVEFYGADGNDIFQSTSVVPVHAYGNAGDDSLTGGVSDDLLNGGEGADRLFGNLGDDNLVGGDGDDQLNGGDGSDRLAGDRGDDRLNGQGDDDTLLGGGGNDVMHGDGGNDRLYGNSGDDDMHGDLGMDRLYGHGGNDILRGGFDNDVIFGGPDSDILHGDGGDDRLSGQAGADEVFGGNDNDFIHLGPGNDRGFGGKGNDRIVGSHGDDQMWGEQGDDILLGNVGSDEMWGGTGGDTLRGSAGNDILHGEVGPDKLFGDVGNDSLYGGAGLDKLWGGAGMDGLFGGIDSARDRIYGQGGQDRYLYREADLLLDRFENSEGLVEFIDSSASWTDREVEIVDEALRKFHFRTNNTRLLVDSVSEEAIQFVKVSGLPGGDDGENVLETERERFFNEETQRFEVRSTFVRKIVLVDWDESSMVANGNAESATINLMAKNYDSKIEMVAVDNEATQVWADFMLASDWTDRFPNNSASYQISGDGLWWYGSDSVFAKSHGSLNPSEDWSTVWDYYFTVSRNSGDAELQTKLSQVDAYLRTFSAL
ncbi:hypothetical protein OAG56_00880 [Mariniblastus sp.]|jgi:Ca2+-binding RTX toxin-like protein|nr:calcium-binding protein [Mariniblastus sp.]MDB4755896.1 hypothetical protein [Mariniblastus sp.]